MNCGLCKDCRFWDDDVFATAAGKLEDGEKICIRPVQPKLESLMYTNGYDLIITAANFGCVQFEAKV